MCSLTVRPWLRAGAPLLAALLVSACGGHFVSRGADLYADGRYVDAAEVFEQTEPRLADSSPRERARFGLYRGANYLKLGDAPHAAQWLGYSRSIVKAAPNALDAGERALLEGSLKALADIEPAVPEQPRDSEVAAVPASSDVAPTQ
jgi:hypothetical protein